MNYISEGSVSHINGVVCSWDESTTLPYDGSSVGLIKPLNTDSEDQLAALRMSFMVTPALPALEDEAPLTEWAPRMEVSMPDKVGTLANEQLCWRRLGGMAL